LSGRGKEDGKFEKGPTKREKNLVSRQAKSQKNRPDESNLRVKKGFKTRERGLTGEKKEKTVGPRNRDKKRGDVEKLQDIPQEKKEKLSEGNACLNDGSGEKHGTTREGL